MPNADSNAIPSTIHRLADQVRGIDFRLHSVEAESDDHESDFESFTQKMKKVEARLDQLERGRARDASTTDEISFNVLCKVSEVKSIVSKRLYDLDPEVADAIWRAVDRIQQLTERAISIEVTTTHPM